VALSPNAVAVKTERRVRDKLGSLWGNNVSWNETDYCTCFIMLLTSPGPPISMPSNERPIN
jgi:hypothetical protein